MKLRRCPDQLNVLCSLTLFTVGLFSFGLGSIGPCTVSWALRPRSNRRPKASHDAPQPTKMSLGREGQITLTAAPTGSNKNRGFP